MVWDPNSVGLNGELEKVQKRAGRCVTRNYIHLCTCIVYSTTKETRYFLICPRFVFDLVNI